MDSLFLTVMSFRLSGIVKHKTFMFVISLQETDTPPLLLWLCTINGVIMLGGLEHHGKYKDKELRCEVRIIYSSVKGLSFNMAPCG